VGSRISIGDGEGADGLDRLHVLFVDNFDSFTYNLVECVSEHAERRCCETPQRSPTCEQPIPTPSSSRRGAGVYEGLDQDFQRGRYHSLVAVDVPEPSW